MPIYTEDILNNPLASKAVRLSSKVYIPFRDDMVRAIENGMKCCTSRNKRYGDPGDHFMLRGKTYHLTSIQHYTLDHVAHGLFREEGTNSSAEFIALWEEIHPLKGFDPNQKVWTHFFEVVQ
jgi:hypothetical protein